MDGGQAIVIVCRTAQQKVTMALRSIGTTCDGSKQAAYCDFFLQGHSDLHELP